MRFEEIKVKNGKAWALEVGLKNGSLVMAYAKNGYVMCGYLNMATAEKLVDCAAVVRGVKNAEDLLKGRVVEVSAAASRRGIRPGMSGRAALSKMV